MLLLKASTSNINKKEFRLCSMMHCITEALKRYPFQKDELALICAKNNDFLFKGDELLMIHVLFNLFKNSIYYIKSSGKGKVELWCEYGDVKNSLHFRDTGQGIKEKDLPQIFNHFFTKTKHGAGIGLAFCKLVMESFGGDISCESLYGKYTEFILKFPVYEKQES